MGFANYEDHLGQYPPTNNRLNNSYLLTAPTNTEDSGSPYSPSGASYTDNSYNSLPRNTATNSILKNGSLRSRSRAYQDQNNTSTVLRPMKYHHQNSYDNGYGMDTVDYNNGYNNGYDETTEANIYNDNNHFAYNDQNGYNNGNVAAMAASDQPLLEDHHNKQLNSCLKKKPMANNSHHLTNNSDLNGLNNLENNANNTKLGTNNEDSAYPIAAKHSPSLQIIATRNRQCCDCLRYNQRAPLCLLFLIFIVVSCSLITGVMFYLKSGKTTF